MRPPPQMGQTPWNSLRGPLPDGPRTLELMGPEFCTLRLGRTIPMSAKARVGAGAGGERGESNTGNFSIRDPRHVKCGSTAWVGATCDTTLRLGATFPFLLWLRRPRDPRHSPVPTKVNAATLLCKSSLHCLFSQSLASVGLRCPVLWVSKDRRPIAFLAQVWRTSPAAPPRCHWYTSPPHPPTHRRSLLLLFYYAALIMAISSSWCIGALCMCVVIMDISSSSCIGTARRHRRRRQSTRDRWRTHRAPSPAPSAVSPWSH